VEIAQAGKRRAFFAVKGMSERLRTWAVIRLECSGEAARQLGLGWTLAKCRGRRCRRREIAAAMEDWANVKNDCISKKLRQGANVVENEGYVKEHLCAIEDSGAMRALLYGSGHAEKFQPGRQCRRRNSCNAGQTKALHQMGLYLLPTRLLVVRKADYEKPMEAGKEI